jgi:acyl phosphate:glycerol-3-phosphate acyltransferase
VLSQQPYLALAAAAISAYLIGGLPFGYWFVRFSLGKDIRTMGSGNIGATNVHRSAGKKAGFIVLFLDILKGFLALWVAALLTDDSALGLALATVAVVLGHCYPIFLRFKGGKAVACFVGAAAYLAPYALLTLIFVFIGIVALSKYISLASILSALIFPVVYWMIYRPAPELLMAVIVAGLIIVYRHKGNIERLRKGKENVFSLKGKPA